MRIRNAAAPAVMAGVLWAAPATAGWPTGSGPTIVAYRYVDDDAPPGGDGLSWSTAFQAVQDALDAAAAVPDPNFDNDAVQIRVGGGTYVPQVRLDPADPRTATFHVAGRSVEIAGGFAGYGAPTPDANDPAAYPTVLSGDLTGDDQPGFVNRSDNAYHIVTHASASRCYLSGLTLRAGNATDIQTDHFLASVPNGGAVLNRGLSVIDCLFMENEAERGGAIADDNFTSGVFVTDSVFLANRATAEGGAIRLRQAESPSHLSLTRCRFLGNTAPIGGALACDQSSSPLVSMISGCEFSGNIAQGSTIGTSIGGAISTESAMITLCTFANNAAPMGTGGAVASRGGSNFRNCVFYNNTDLIGDGPDSHIAGSTVDFRACVLPGLDSATGILIPNPTAALPDSSGLDPLLVNPLGPDGVAGTLDDDNRPAAGSPCIDSGVANTLWLGTSVDSVYGLGGEARVVDDPTQPNLASPTQFYLGPIDIGAYEYQADCDANGTLDSVQIADNPALDCDGNGVMDACEPMTDCDGSGVADRCEIASDPTLDRNANGVPDSCDIASGTSADHDKDGIPDEVQPARLFVDGSRPIGSGLSDGLSWATAFDDLEPALSLSATRLAPTEIWVAQGTYTPTGLGAGRSRAFRITGDTTLLGGFAGGETSADERDPAANPTILSGDFNGDDDSGGSNVENALHVVVGPEAGRTAVLDGFIIGRGHADIPIPLIPFPFFENNNSFWPDANGAGVRHFAGDLTLRNCVIRECEAIASASAIYAARLTQWDTSNAPASLHLEASTITANTIAAGLTGATGLFVASPVSSTVDACQFIANLGGTSAASATGVVSNGLFLGNVLGPQSGAFVPRVLSVSNGMLLNSTVAFNNGVGVSAGTNAEIANSILWGNLADSGSVEGDQLLTSDTASIRNSIVQGWTGTLPIAFTAVSGADPLFIDPVGPDLLLGTGDEDLRLSAGSPAIDAGDNTAVPLAIAFDLDGLDRFINDCDTPDSGVPDGLRPLVDLGPFEFQAASIMGDANADGAVDVDDLNTVLSAWMTTVPTPGLGGDVTGDAFVDMDDLNEVLGAWLEECG